MASILCRILQIAAILTITLAFSHNKGNIINLRPRQQSEIASDNSHVFAGNQSNGEPEHFKLLTLTGDFLTVGARDVVYNLSVHSLELQQKLDWEASQSDVDVCQMKGKSSADCHNYVRVMVAQTGGRMLICGTNAFKPTCRQYAQSTHGGVAGYQMLRQFDGYAISPFDPSHNSTSVLVTSADGDEIYAGTVTDFAGTDALIYRQRLSFDGVQSDDQGKLRTKRDQLTVLNNPDFVGSIARGEYVYFWLRETAVEYSNQYGESVVYSRVARVCRRDKGGPIPHSASWTTFVKARLECKLPAKEQAFHFDQLQAVSDVIRESDGSDVVYGVFSSGDSQLGMSAVCAYRLSDIDQLFDHGTFMLTPQNLRAPWMSALPHQVPSPRPGKCVPNSRALNDQTVTFIMRNMLMADGVHNRFPQPLLIDNSMRCRFTQITVASDVRAVNSQRYDLVYIGTSDGRVLKLVRTSAGHSVIIESVRVLTKVEPVRNLLVHEDTVVVVGDQQLRAISISRCEHQNTCAGCVRLQDPHCAWAPAENQCVHVQSTKIERDTLVQNVDTGKSPVCPEGEYDPSMYAVNDIHAQLLVPGEGVRQAGVSSSSTGSIAVAVVLTLAVASTIGFLVGYWLSQWKLKQSTTSVSSGGSSTISSCDYESNSLSRARLTARAIGDNPKLIPLPGLNGETATNIYASPPPPPSGSANAVPTAALPNPTLDTILFHPNLTLPTSSNTPSMFRGSPALMTGSMTLSRTPTLQLHRDRPLLAATQSHITATANGTLPRDYKVKRAYV